MASETGFVTVDAGQKAAGKVVVTPSTQPVGGIGHAVAEVSIDLRASCATAAVSTTLELTLPMWANVGDKVYWTSFD